MEAPLFISEDSYQTGENEWTEYPTYKPTEAAPIRLEAHICDQRRNYLVEFATEDQALKFIEEKKSTHAFHTFTNFPIDEKYTRLLDVMHPTCEHGLSEANCLGPDHYSRELF